MPDHVLKIPRTHQLKIPAGTCRAGQQCHFAGQPHRFPELHRNLDIRRGQVLGQRRQCARLVPQPMGDGRREAEQFGAGGTQVNRVVVAGHLGVLPANVRRRFPARHFDQRQRRCQHLLDGFALEFDATAQHLAFGFPQRPQLIIERGHQVERRALGVRLQVLHLHADPHTIHAAHGPQDADAVAQVNQPQQRETEIPWP